MTDIFTKDGVKLVGMMFITGFAIGLLGGVVGFCLIVDVLAGR